jgi:phosphoribosylformylglycinamidine cyclo-ligase
MNLFSKKNKSGSDKQGKSPAYAKAGVDIDLAQDLLRKVKDKLNFATRSEVLAPIGGFGGLFQINLYKYSDPVLVTSIDGIGTKLVVANMMERYDTLGYDIVNHCINDVAVSGAEPLYFLDYLGIGRLRSPLYEQLLAGLADACAAQKVALIGGETAEMPGMYGDDFDVVGCITGIVDRYSIINGEDIRPGNVVIGLAANGLHTNGYSLARKVLFEEAGLECDTVPEGMSESVGDALLRPHYCYWPCINRALSLGIAIKGMAHITGGGWFDNIKRILPDETHVVCDTGVLPVPPIMQLIQEKGDIDLAEMHRVFNMGMGMAWVVPAESAEAAIACCDQEGVLAKIVGEVVFGEQSVELRNT